MTPPLSFRPLGELQVKSIYVCNLPSDVDEEMMTSLFAEYGEIERIVLSKNLASAVSYSLLFPFCFVDASDSGGTTSPL